MDLLTGLVLPGLLLMVTMLLVNAFMPDGSRTLQSWVSVLAAVVSALWAFAVVIACGLSNPDTSPSRNATCGLTDAHGLLLFVPVALFLVAAAAPLSGRLLLSRAAVVVAAAATALLVALTV